MTMIDTDKFFSTNDALAQSKKREVEELNEALKKHISPAGALGLPPLLDERRLKYGIPDEVFVATCMYEFIHIYQIDLIENETAGADSLIIRTEATRDRNIKEAHRGVIVGAGLSALDIGISNGWALGHIVNFIQLAPYRQRMVTIRGKDWHVLCLRAGDIRSSEDTQALLRSGAIRLAVVKDANGRPEHRYVYTSTGELWTPMAPWLADNM